VDFTSRQAANCKRSVFKESDITNYITLNRSTTEIYLNYTAISAKMSGRDTNPSALVQTLIHELLHVYYQKKNQKLWFTWWTIRNKKSVYRYSLADFVSFISNSL
jgi:hypothetical protein